ncbi:MAG: hypothetical protein RR090_05430 [Niameybacter sp.]|uniref:hypothetical protein n=1 Tax=Niameybacter sp. TaxID=2033640 RepID=UPI002FCB9D53
MPNLFDGIKKVSEDELREQIALLETFTMTNLSKQTGQKVAKKLVQATNLVAGLMKKVPFQAPEVQSTEELIEKNKLQWQMLDREALEQHLKNVLKQKSQSLKSGIIDADASADALSVFMIDQAAELYGIKEELLPSQKADLIKKCYEDEMRDFQKEIQQALQAQQTQASTEGIQGEEAEKNLEEEAFDIQAAERIDIDAESDIQVHSSMLNEEVEGYPTEQPQAQQLLRMRLEQSIGALQLPLGKNKLIRELFAQLITLSVCQEGGQMAIDESDLPSFLPLRNRQKLEQNYQDLMKQQYQNEAHYQQVLQSLLAIEGDISAKKRVIEREEQQQEETKGRIEKLIAEKKNLQSKLDEQKDGLSLSQEEDILAQLQQLEMTELRTAKEMKMKETEIITYEGMLMMSKEEMRSAIAYIDIFTRKKEDITPELQKVLAKKDDTALRIHSEKAARQKALEEKWQAIYSGFKFEKECLQTVHTTFTLYERLDIERALLELHSMEDVKALSWGELEKKDYESFKILPDEHELHHMVFSLVDETISIIVYEPLEEEHLKARIVKVFKYNEHEPENE